MGTYNAGYLALKLEQLKKREQKLHKAINRAEENDDRETKDLLEELRVENDFYIRQIHEALNIQVEFEFQMPR